MNILILGGLGYVGTHLLFGLFHEQNNLPLNFNVTVFDRELPFNNVWDIVTQMQRYQDGARLRFIRGNVLDDRSKLKQLIVLYRIDVVINLIGGDYLFFAEQHPTYAYQTILGTTLTVLDVLETHPNILYIQTSSAAAMSPQTSLYAKLKSDMEQMIYRVRENNSVILRQDNLFGSLVPVVPLPPPEKLLHLVDRCLYSDYLVVGEENDEIRDYVWIQDLIRAYQQVMIDFFLNNKTSVKTTHYSIFAGNKLSTSQMLDLCQQWRKRTKPLLVYHRHRSSSTGSVVVPSSIVGLPRWQPTMQLVPNEIEEAYPEIPPSPEV
jgi:nucleoside-diphosphate-sugar epimerase